MALRVLLVSLVASMGFELPSGQDMESWTRTGSQWVSARMADLSNLRVEAERTLVDSSDTDQAVEPTPSANRQLVSIREDLTFDAIVEEMAANFATDLATIEVPNPAEEALAVAQPADKMPEAASPPMESAVTVPELVVAETTPEPEPTPTSTTEVSSRGERLSTAVQLTKQALNAWVSLIQPTGGEVTDLDRDDTL